jgi:thiosulfate/3-mercaptopyruvate sulfurtransferase
MMLYKPFTFLLALLLLIGSCRQAAKAPPTTDEIADFGDSPYLLSVDEVAALLQSPEPPLLLEISKAVKFAEGHLPGAVNLWRPDYGDDENFPYGGMRASRDKMARLLGKLGATPDELIVVYCTKGSADATRLIWILRSYGHDGVVMMDGGKAGWQHAGHRLTKELAKQRPPTTYQFAGPEMTDYIASSEDVLAAISDTNTIIVDTREDYEYLGLPHRSNNAVVRFKKGAFTYGAIPGARHLNWSEAVDLHSDHTFKSLADLNHNFLRQGITPDKRIIVYCQSGVRSAHTTFVLTELLGYPDVRNYDGSWIEWSFIHKEDTSGKLQRHSNAEETEVIYQELLATAQEAEANKIIKE